MESTFCRLFVNKQLDYLTLNVDSYEEYCQKLKEQYEEFGKKTKMPPFWNWFKRWALNEDEFKLCREVIKSYEED